MANQTNSKAKALLGWMDDRFPLSKMWNEHLAQYYAPKNFNFWYYFGSLALLVLVIQIVSGIFLTMNYKPLPDNLPNYCHKQQAISTNLVQAQAILPLLCYKIFQTA